MLTNTDVEGIKRASAGVLVDISTSAYADLRAKKIEELKQQNRINTIESDVADIKKMLEQILKRVS